MRSRGKTLGKKLALNLGVALAGIGAIGGAALWWKFSLPQQSMMRLASAVKMRELGWALHEYVEQHKKLPEMLEDLNPREDVAKFHEFEYVRGINGILAYRKDPFRKVEKGEPWGGNGQVAKREIPAARLVLFKNGSIGFLEESDFRTIYVGAGERAARAELEELIPGMNWGRWFRERSGYAPDSKYFGAYVTLGVGDDLYIGLGRGRPSLGDGALVARFDGNSIEAMGSLAEEGIHEMIWDDQMEVLHIAGTDPSWPDDWSAGNHYTYLRSGPKSIVKHRDPRNGLVNVIHTWGLWLSDSRVLHAAVNSHDGSFTRDRNFLRRIYNRINWMLDSSHFSRGYGMTRMGQIFKSSDNGKTWERVSDLGYFRAYDIVGFNDKLYAIYSDMPESPCKVAVSEDGGESWRDVSRDHIQRVHLTKFENKLLAVSLDRRSIYAMNLSNENKYDLPEGLEVAADMESGFKILVTGNGYLYGICRENNGNYCIFRTSDLQTWEKIVSTKKKVISISYWQTRRWVILSDKGSDAKLWKIDVSRL